MSIHKKLLEFQKLGITLKKDGINPHFRSSYVTLNEVLDKVKGPLNKLGVIIVQCPLIDGTGAIPGLYTRLIDTEHTKDDGYDGKEITSFVPFINPTDMQKLGGAISYARRYALISMLALEDEDDDGNQASGTKTSAKSVLDAVGDPLKDDFTL